MCMAEELCLCDPFGVVGVWDLPMAMKFMCMLFGFPFIFFVCEFKARDV